MSKKYDIAIIGGGLGGLVCANILSRNGYSVCVVEKNDSIGGCLQDFQRNGCHFDTGVHYIGSYDKGQVLRKIFDYLQISDLIEVKRLSDKAFDKVNVSGTEYHFPQGIENFRKQLIEQFPEEQEAVNSYVDKMIEVVQGVDLLNLRHVDVDKYHFYDAYGISAYDYIYGLTQNQSLRDILSSFSLLANNQTTTATLYVYFVISYSYLSSSYKVLGGGRSIADALEKIAKENGAEVLLNSEVKQIRLTDGLADTLVLANGESIKAQNVISDIPPVNLLEMLPEKTFRKVFVNRLKRLKHSASMFSVYVVFNERTVEYDNSNYYYFKNSEAIWRDDTIDMTDWPKGFLIIWKESPKHKGFAESAMVMSQIDYSFFAKWEHTKVEKRGADYKKQKQKCSDELLNLVEQLFPNFTKNIKKQYSSTPLTYRDYTGVPQGAMYGTVQDFNNPLGSTLFTATNVKNLVLTGQNVNLHGVLGVTLTALVSCGHFLDLNEIIEEIIVPLK